MFRLSTYSNWEGIASNFCHSASAHGWPQLCCVLRFTQLLSALIVILKRVSGYERPLCLVILDSLMVSQAKIVHVSLVRLDVPKMLELG